MVEYTQRTWADKDLEEFPIGYSCGVACSPYCKSASML